MAEDIKMKVLVVVDMQNDFIDGSLGSSAAVGITDAVGEYVRNFEGKIIFTRDTHPNDYLNTEEGKRLPVPHCIENTHGWQISDKIPVPDGAEIIDKPSFGSLSLAGVLKEINEKTPIAEIELLGLCTDICVISNAMIAKAALPEVKITVNAALSRGVSKESHDTALSAMRACHIDIKE